MKRTKLALTLQHNRMDTHTRKVFGSPLLFLMRMFVSGCQQRELGVCDVPRLPGVGLHPLLLARRRQLCPLHRHTPRTQTPQVLHSILQGPDVN